MKYCTVCGKQLISMIIPSVKTGKYNALTGEPEMTKEIHTRECSTHACGHDRESILPCKIIEHGPWKNTILGRVQCVKCGRKYK